MGASSAGPSTSSKEMAFRNTEKRQHGNPQLKASGRGGANHTCSHQRQSENVDPTPTQLCRRHAGGFRRFRGGCSEERVSRAKQAAQTRPLKEQVAQNDAFIQRSQKRIASLERERAEEQALLDKALVWHERLKQEVAAAEPVPAEVPMQESNTEVLFLRAKVAQERIPHPVRGSVDAAESLRSRLTKRKTGNCPEDNLPTNQKDLHSWLEAKQLELRDAVDVHDMESVSLLTGLISIGAAAMNSCLKPSSVAHMVH